MAGGYRQHRGLVVAEADLETLRAAGLDSFDALMAAPGEVMDKKRLARWRQRVALRAGGRRLYLKRYRNPPPLVQLGQRLRGFAATAAVEWHWLRRLPELEIEVPRAVAFGCRRRGLRERESLVLMDAVSGDALERRLADGLGGRLADRRFRRRLIGALAALAARLHGAGLVHRDLYLSHVFLADDANAAPRLALIDLQRVMRPRLRWRRWAIKDLAALNYSTPAAAASAADRLRWWRAYRGGGRLSPADKRIIRAVARKTRRIARRAQRRA